MGTGVAGHGCSRQAPRHRPDATARTLDWKIARTVSSAGATDLPGLPLNLSSICP